MSPRPAQAQKAPVPQRAERRASTPSDHGSPPQVGETAEMRERRRKQNRLAQQAFRSRQKVRVDALEGEWQQLRHLHEGLNQACSQRSKEIEQLHTRVEELLRDIEFLKSSQGLDQGWSSPSSSSCASSSYAPSTYSQRLPQPEQRTFSQFDLENYISKGSFSEFAGFPMSREWTQGSSR